MISEAKVLLRSLPVCSPSSASERALKRQLDYSHSNVPGLIALSSWSPAPRGRRLVTALAMSCLGSLVVAAPFGSGTLNMMAMRPLGFSTLGHLEQKRELTDPSAMFAPLRPMPGSIALQATPASWNAGYPALRNRSPYADAPYVDNTKYQSPIGQGYLVAFGNR